MNEEQNAAAEYPDDEQPALAKLNVLMGEWKSQVSKYTVWDSGN
jgi:hypothetical protein